MMFYLLKQMIRMDQKLQIIKRQFGIAFAPAVTQGAERLTRVLEDMSDEFVDVAEKTTDFVVGIVFLIENIRCD